MRCRSLLRSVVGQSSRAAFSTSSSSRAVTAFRFPAMSPTMTEGGIASWKVKEGESFAPGDVLFEIETDKATMDVETTEEGVMGKIIAPDGTKNLQVGTLIAILAEEGDDLSTISASDYDSAPPDTAPPSSSSSSSASPPPAPTPAPAAPTPAPTPAPASSSGSHSTTSFAHPRPLSPAVNRLLLTSTLTSDQVSTLKGSGVRGALTKGDVLKAMGKIDSVWGSKEAAGLVVEGKKGVSARFKLPPSAGGSPAAAAEAAPPPPQDPVSVRRAVVAGFSTAPSPSATSSVLDFDSLLADYAVNKKAAPKKAVEAAPVAKKSVKKVVESGEFEGIW
ncbi:hypothetical protein BDY24DRAFT_391936 [Mrakia frigida]|uniref:Pdx1p n=1 Tax=Mrakia frigida TaxID=29902 RepID=UPI003FCC1A38